jgi:hypothetical protein
LKILFSKGEKQEEKVNDNQDQRIVVPTTMAEKLKAFSLIVAMLDVSTPSQ